MLKLQNLKIDLKSNGQKMVACTCMNNYKTWVEILQWKLHMS